MPLSLLPPITLPADLSDQRRSSASSAASEEEAHFSAVLRINAGLCVVLGDTEILVSACNDAGHERMSVTIPNSATTREILAQFHDEQNCEPTWVTFGQVLEALKHLGVPVLGRFAAAPVSDPTTPGYQKLFTLAEIPDPVDARDTATGCRGKAALYSERVLEQISTEIPGQKAILFLDFNHMSATNSHGLRAEVDSLIQQLPRIVAQRLSATPHELFRAGGDEFVLITQNTGAETLEQLEAVLNDYRLLRDQVLSPGDERVAEANRFTAVRDAGRKLFARHFPPGKPGSAITEERFTATLRGFCESTPGLATKTSGQLLLTLAQRVVANSKPESLAMSISAAVVAGSENLTMPELISGLAKLDKSIHAKKEAGDRTLGEMLAADRSIKGRQATHAIVSTISKAEKELMDSSRNPLALYRSSVSQALALCQDVTIGAGVLRFGIAQRMLVGQLFPITTEREISVTEFDIARFGVINNQLGYDRGDELFRALACAARSNSESAVLMRKDGGKLLVLTETPLTDEQREKISGAAVNAIQSAGIVERGKVEASFRDALEELAQKSSNAKRAPELGSVSVRSGKFRVSSSQYLSTAMRHAELALAFKQLA